MRKRGLYLVIFFIIIELFSLISSEMAYIPPQQTTPIIESINLPEKVEAGSSIDISIIIKNNGSNSGYINVEPINPPGGIQPLSQNVLLENSVTVNFHFSVPYKTGLDGIEFKVCSQSQFEGPNCDSKTVSFYIDNSTKEDSKKFSFFPWIIILIIVILIIVFLSINMRKSKKEVKK